MSDIGNRIRAAKPDVDDTDERAREIAAGLSPRQRDAFVNMDSKAGRAWNTITVHARGEQNGLVYYAAGGRSLIGWQRTDLGRAVARVLASQEVDRG